MEEEAGSVNQETTSRKAFLRRLGTTLAVGIGGIALLPSRAVATTQACSSCCRESCKSCSSGVAYRCNNSGRSCCICHSNVGTCFGTQICYC